jgi:fatty acid synthase subunit beta
MSAAAEGSASKPVGLLAAAFNTSSSVGLALVAGGQGYTYLEELRACCVDGVPPITTTIAAALAAEVASPEGVAAGCWAAGLDLLAWIKDPATTPPLAYLCSAPVSYALIYTTQLTHYALALTTTGVSHAEMLSVLKSSSGHSQGVVAAVVISSSSSDEQLLARAAAGGKYMVWQGARCHQVLNADVVYSGPAPEASPMLAVAGLTAPALKAAVASFNQAAGAELAAVSIINNTKECCVSGTTDAMIALRARIGQVRCTPPPPLAHIPFPPTHRQKF